MVPFSRCYGSFSGATLIAQTIAIEYCDIECARLRPRVGFRNHPQGGTLFAGRSRFGYTDREV
jgi:hypothetical protein